MSPAESLYLDGFISILGVELLCLQHHVLIKLPHHDCFFMSCFRPFHLRFVWSRKVHLIEFQVVRLVRHLNFFAAGKYFVTAVLLIPLRDGRILVHVFDDISPAYACVICTEGDLAFLSSVRDNAHLRATKIIVEEVLEPHAGDEKKIPTICTTLLNIGLATVAAHLAIIFACQTKRLVKLFKELIKRKLRRRFVWVVVLEQRQAHHNIRHPLAARRVGNLLHVLDKARDIQKLRHRPHLFAFLVDHYRGANATVWVTTAGDLAPFCPWAMYKIS